MRNKSFYKPLLYLILAKSRLTPFVLKC
uniref:Uncharacterized protein n=1 Tax=Anguilla anguilla TaxID=7936 RepID=A0A0E9TP45_ANGAN